MITKLWLLRIGYLAVFWAWSFLIFKDFSNEIDDGINVNFLTLYNKMCQLLEELLNLVNQYFPYDQCMMLQIKVWVKNSLKM